LRQNALGQIPDQAEDPRGPHAGEAVQEIKQALRRSVSALARNQCCQRTDIHDFRLLDRVPFIAPLIRISRKVKNALFFGRTRSKQRLVMGKLPARRFPVQSEIQKLENELNAFNERIAELEDEGHQSHAMDILKANALDFARRIDELRCILVESTSKDETAR